MLRNFSLWQNGEGGARQSTHHAFGHTNTSPKYQMYVAICGVMLISGYGIFSMAPLLWWLMFAFRLVNLMGQGMMSKY